MIQLLSTYLVIHEIIYLSPKYVYNAPCCSNCKAEKNLVNGILYKVQSGSHFQFCERI